MTYYEASALYNMAKALGLNDRAILFFIDQYTKRPNGLHELLDIIHRLYIKERNI